MTSPQRASHESPKNSQIHQERMKLEDRISKFIPALLDQKITIRPLQGQPLTGILRDFNSYELLVEVDGILHIVFKHSIHAIQILETEKFNQKRKQKME
jgi:sRNA-binding regulator protein Hfq